MQPRSPYRNATFSRIDQFVSILGTTKVSFWPFLGSQFGSRIPSYGGANHNLTASKTAAAAVNVTAEMLPHQHMGGVFSYDLSSGQDHHLAGSDHNDFSFTDGAGDDAACSFGAWIAPRAIASEQAIIAKYGSTANLEEWKMVLDGTGKPKLELHDASASASETATASSAVTANAWSFVVATYDGDEETPEVFLYTNGVVDNDGTTTESGSYVGMENTASIPIVGATDASATPANEFDGRLSMVFSCGKTLSDTEVANLYRISRPLMGA